MTPDHADAVAVEPCGKVQPRPDLSALLARQRQLRASADMEATKRVTDRLTSGPTLDSLRGELEDVLVDVAAHAVHAMVKLRNQRHDGSLDPSAISNNLSTAAEALRSAELLTAVIQSVRLPPASQQARGSTSDRDCHGTSRRRTGRAD